jgi:hypothetical protein
MARLLSESAGALQSPQIARKGKVAFVAGWRMMMVKQKALSNRRVSECGKICIYFMKLKKYDDKRHTLMLLCMHVVVLLCLSCTPEFNHDFRRPGYIYIYTPLSKP